MLRGEASCVWGQRSSTSTEDPCHAGSLPSGQGLSNSVMSCFDLGPGTERLPDEYMSLTN